MARQEEQNETPFQPELFAYWNEKRGPRPAPDRAR